MRRLTLTLISLLLFVASLMTSAPRTVSQTPDPWEKPTGSVSRSAPVFTNCVVLTVYDGDTLGCDFNQNSRVDGKAEHVRLLGIDAPEMRYSRKNETGRDQPQAREALMFLNRHLLHQRVYLEYDEDPIDRYDRQLAYVYRGREKTQMVNEALLSRGLAKLLFMGINRRYEEKFSALENTARTQHLGIWSISP